ncbi:MAG: DEAD/DEAH box helicase family protein [Nitrososphaerota archaeon]
MSHYIHINDDNFYQFINKKFSQYKIPQKKVSLKQICYPTSYEFQIPQKFLAEFINPKTPYRGILIYHRIGAGKTCTAINIAEKFKDKRKIIVVLPAFLRGNFRSELRSLCTGQKYLTDQERELLKKLQPYSSNYKEIIKRSDAKIDEYYTIYSYNKFVQLLKLDILQLKNTLLIIDEVHNMISESGTSYKILYKAIHSAPDDLRLVLMTATPIFDKPMEIALTMNLLLREKQIPVGSEFVRTFIVTKQTKSGIVYRVKNIELFKQYIRGYVSYFRGAPPIAFPEVKFKVIKCQMSEFQRYVYERIIKKERKGDIKDYLNVDIPNNFFIGTRMVSNVIFPNGKIGKKGFESIEDKDFEIPRLIKYSPKFVKILERIRRTNGTVFVYSNFKEYGGIYTFTRVLEHHGYKNYEEYGTGRRRYAIWSGDQSAAIKEEIKEIFNRKDNEDGSNIKIICGSPSVREGVSFMRVQQVHIMEPYWNQSRISQVAGRVIRFCSHKDVKPEKRVVKVYLYIAVHPLIKMSIDQKIMQMAIRKKMINSHFEKALKESAIDCQLFYNANVYPGEEPINCSI